jgi:hypothetical protein
MPLRQGLVRLLRHDLNSREYANLSLRDGGSFTVAIRDKEHGYFRWITGTNIRDAKRLGAHASLTVVKGCCPGRDVRSPVWVLTR